MADALVLVTDERGHAHYFQRDAFTALVAVGLIRVDAEGRARYTYADIDMVQFPELASCDFCLGRPVTWDIEARTFEDPVSGFTSVGGWAACEACGQAVSDGDRRALEARALSTRILHLFWQHFISIARFNSPYREEP